ncbi:MAG: hypothetical protein ACR2GY_12945 [Phycisphaerales bacterium]
MLASRIFIVVMPLSIVCASSASAGGSDDSSSLFEPPIRLKAGGEYIDTDIGHAAPYVYDFDRDGIDDLLVGQFGEGKLRIYRNAGSNEKPVYESHQWFKADHEYGTVPTG